MTRFKVSFFFCGRIGVFVGAVVVLVVVTKESTVLQ